MNSTHIGAGATHLAGHAGVLAQHAHALAAPAAGPPFTFLFTVFVLAVFVGYYVVWGVTPALHSPLLSLTNAISSVIIVGAMLAAGFSLTRLSAGFGFVAVMLASVNIFGGFVVTQRMLQMFRKKN
ncbi:MAG: proton-translocating transhydrogenase family protein [Stellaceae bacterium]